MFLGAILILTLTPEVLLAETNSSFNLCYFNETSGQCPSGEECGIVPPMNILVRRRIFLKERDQTSLEASWLKYGRRRRKRSFSSRRTSTSSTTRRSSYPTCSSGSTSWRYGDSISQLAYGSTITGITSRTARYVSTWYWWNSSTEYYSWRESNSDVDDLLESQGVCINTGELQTMTEQDCYNWCMSLKYDDSTCADDCCLSKGVSLNTTTIVLITLALLCACGVACFYYIRKKA